MSSPADDAQRSLSAAAGGSSAPSPAPDGLDPLPSLRDRIRRLAEAAGVDEAIDALVDAFGVDRVGKGLARHRHPGRKPLFVGQHAERVALALLCERHGLDPVATIAGAFGKPAESIRRGLSTSRRLVHGRLAWEKMCEATLQAMEHHRGRREAREYLRWYARQRSSWPW